MDPTWFGFGLAVGSLGNYVAVGDPQFAQTVQVMQVSRVVQVGRRRGGAAPAGR